MIKAARLAGKEANRETRAALKESGEIVREEWEILMRPIYEPSARTLRTRVRQRGVSVEQTRRKTTGQHPEFGALQMRRGVSALEDKEGEVVKSAEKAVDRIADHFDK